MLSDGTYSILMLAFYASIVSYFLLGLLMRRFWFMISTLQIIVHFPMLGINYPPIVLVYFSAIIEVTNMNILPMQWIKQHFPDYIAQ